MPLRGVRDHGGVANKCKQQGDETRFDERSPPDHSVSHEARRAGTSDSSDLQGCAAASRRQSKQAILDLCTPPICFALDSSLGERALLIAHTTQRSRLAI